MKPHTMSFFQISEDFDPQWWPDCVQHNVIPQECRIHPVLGVRKASDDERTV